MPRPPGHSNDDPPPPSFAPADETTLQEVRSTLLHHHRSLVEFAKLDYERGHGRVGSAGELVRLLMHDPSFGWLRVLSSLIASLDEVLDEPVSGQAETVIETADRLLLGSDADPTGFRLQYHDALQRSPDIVLSHARVAAVLKGLRGVRFGLQAEE
jgi:hypothetical protein